MPPSVHTLPGHSHNPLSSYCYFPDHDGFETKKSGEKVILRLRRHPLTNLGWILTVLILAVFPIFFSALPVLTTIPANFREALYLIWYLILTGVAVEGFLLWLFNVYLVTDRRVVEVDFYGLLSKSISDAEIEKIQDVTYRVGGILGTIFHYGDVLIQTASEEGGFKFSSVPNPGKAAKILKDLRDQVGGNPI